MKLSLSVNWCNRRIESGEEIADTAAAAVPTMLAIAALTLSALTVFASVWAAILSLAVNKISHLQTIIVK